MIRNEAERKEALGRLATERVNLSQLEGRLKAAGLTGDDLEVVMAPMQAQLGQLEDEVQSYERLKSGDLGAYTTVGSLGRLLTAARIACGFSNRDLAARLGCHESQVSRDERNDYRGITLSRLSQLIEAFGLDVRLCAHLRNRTRDAASAEMATWAASVSRMPQRRDPGPVMIPGDAGPGSWDSRAPKTLASLPAASSPIDRLPDLHPKSAA